MTSASRSLAAFAVAVCAMSCARQLPGSFTCTVSSQCVLAGSAGVCEPTGACSFPDASCPSGRRYGGFGPSDLGGSCVVGMGGVDLAGMPPATRDMATHDMAATHDLASAPGAIAHAGNSAVALAAGGVSLPLPAGTVAGDVLIVEIYGASMSATIAAPSGWSLIANVAGGDFVAAWYYKVAGANETSPLAFPVTGAMSSGACVSYRGVSTVAPIDSSTSQQFEAAAYLVPSIVATHAGDRLLALFVDESKGAALATPTGMTNVLTDAQIVFYDAALTSAGATGSRSASAGAIPGLGAVAVVALAPAP